MPRFTIWSNASLTSPAIELLRVGTRNHDLILDEHSTSNLASRPSDQIGLADIAFGQPDPQQAAASERLSWVHLSSAGYTRYDTRAFRDALAARRAQLTNSSSVFDEPCAQHLLAFMLGLARQLPQAVLSQRAQSWCDETLRGQTRLLRGETVLILGYGAIARRLATLLSPFALDVHAFRRQPTGTEPVSTHPIAEWKIWIPRATHIINTLPMNDETSGLVDREAIAACSSDAVFYNIGRGGTVDHEALLAALNGGGLRGAYLDVVDPEPPPIGHPLWTARNCWITPHIGGGRKDEFEALVEHFLSNLRRYEQSEPLVDVVMGTG